MKIGRFCYTEASEACFCKHPYNKRRSSRRLQRLLLVGQPSQSCREQACAAGLIPWSWKHNHCRCHRHRTPLCTPCEKALWTAFHPTPSPIPPKICRIMGVVAGRNSPTPCEKALWSAFLPDLLSTPPGKRRKSRRCGITCTTHPFREGFTQNTLHRITSVST